MKKKFLFISQSQFGHLVDYYQYVLILNDEFDITYLCWDYNLPKIENDSIKCIYIARNGNIITRNLRFIKAAFSVLKDQSFNHIYINYFRGSSLLALFSKSKNKMFIDIRSAGVMPSKIKRYIYDKFMTFECRFFKNICVVSEGVKRRLNLPKKSLVIPLGANKITVSRNQMEGLYLLYVGTFINRNIHQTVVGIKLFHDSNPTIPISYTIIGSGDTECETIIKNTIASNQLENIVTLVGYVQNDQLNSFYANSNIGISYVPITDYFNHQPVTKTFEYLMCGLPVLASGTIENKLIINKDNGIIINDNPISFAEGLEEMSKLMNVYKEEIIMHSVENYEWIKIVENLKRQILKYSSN
jgi:glycosyltransferase involved in cell wall biosynthesis